MEHAIEHQIGEKADVCDVCEISLEHIASPITKEYLSKVFTFCSEKCFKRYLESPEIYAEFSDDEDLDS